jgi:hypothetical protein
MCLSFSVSAKEKTAARISNTRTIGPAGLETFISACWPIRYRFVASRKNATSTRAVHGIPFFNGVRRFTRGAPSQIHRRHNASSTDPVVELENRLPTRPAVNRNSG